MYTYFAYFASLFWGIMKNVANPNVLAYLASEKASCSEVKDDINDLIERGTDAHVLLCIQA